MRKGCLDPGFRVDIDGCRKVEETRGRRIEDFKCMNASYFVTSLGSYNQIALFKFTEIPSSPQSSPPSIPSVSAQ